MQIAVQLRALTRSPRKGRLSEATKSGVVKVRATVSAIERRAGRDNSRYRRDRARVRAGGGADAMDFQRPAILGEGDEQQYRQGDQAAHHDDLMDGIGGRSTP